MIRFLSRDGGERINGLSEPDWAACRIRALAKAYGLEGNILRVYAEEEDGAFLSYEKDFAVLFLRDPALKQEAEELLEVTAGEVLSGTRLRLSGFTEEAGRVYQAQGLKPGKIPGMEAGIGESYRILSGAFPDYVNPETYPEWYADTSHRIRHGMSKVYVLPGICTGTMYCRENGLITVAQLAVAPGYRGKGWGKRMLSHIAADSPPFDQLILLSRNRESDAFYEHIGFCRIGEWYYYARQALKPEWRYDAT